MGGITVSCMAVDWADFEEKPGAVPVYEQFANWLEARIADGSLARGAKLPAERDLADYIGHSPETVAKARRLLVERGLVETHVGRGSFVKSQPDQ
jgi:DNA-binding GntR family transcriptional regulator